MKKMISQITPKHMLDSKILLKLERIFNSIEINPNSTYPLSEPSVERWPGALICSPTFIKIQIVIKITHRRNN